MRCWEARRAAVLNAPLALAPPGRPLSRLRPHQCRSSTRRGRCPPLCTHLWTRTIRRSCHASPRAHPGGTAAVLIAEAGSRDRALFVRFHEKPGPIDGATGSPQGASFEVSQETAGRPTSCPTVARGVPRGSTTNPSLNDEAPGRDLANSAEFHEKPVTRRNRDAGRHSGWPRGVVRRRYGPIARRTCSVWVSESLCKGAAPRTTTCGIRYGQSSFPVKPHSRCREKSCGASRETLLVDRRTEEKPPSARRLDGMTEFRRSSSAGVSRETRGDDLPGFSGVRGECQGGS